MEVRRASSQPSRRSAVGRGFQRPPCWTWPISMAEAAGRARARPGRAAARAASAAPRRKARRGRAGGKAWPHGLLSVSERSARAKPPPGPGRGRGGRPARRARVRAHVPHGEGRGAAWAVSGGGARSTAAAGGRGAPGRAGLALEALGAGWLAWLRAGAGPGAAPAWRSLGLLVLLAADRLRRAQARRCARRRGRRGRWRPLALAAVRPGGALGRAAWTWTLAGAGRRSPARLVPRLFPALAGALAGGAARRPPAPGRQAGRRRVDRPGGGGGAAGGRRPERGGGRWPRWPAASRWAWGWWCWAAGGSWRRSWRRRPLVLLGFALVAGVAGAAYQLAGGARARPASGRGARGAAAAARVGGAAVGPARLGLVGRPQQLEVRDLRP